MSPVAVVTDTTHYMPRALIQELGVHEVSLYVTFEGVTEREADITDLADFYTRLKRSTGMPSTSQPSVGDFLTVYEPLLADGRHLGHLRGRRAGPRPARRGRHRARAHHRARLRDRLRRARDAGDRREHGGALRDERA